MDVYIGADHGGFRLKSDLIDYIRELGHQVTDLGAKTLDQGDDYADYAREMQKVVAARADLTDFRVILICSSGVGMCIAANKINGVRGANCPSPENAYFARLHNDINVLCLSGLRSNTDSIEKVTDGDYQDLIQAGMSTANQNEARRIVKVFLETDTEAAPGTRHRRRLDKIATLE